ncbi:MAG: CcmD family protein [bacterium]|jgi:uncharacterized membrane protein
MKSKFLTLLMTLCSFGAKAQNISTENDATASVMRSNGKIYVVVAVLLTILIGLFAYIIRIDRKISKLEKE